MLQANGITLTFIEKSGLIQTAENLGLLSKISDRCGSLGIAAAEFSFLTECKPEAQRNSVTPCFESTDMQGTDGLNQSFIGHVCADVCCWSWCSNTPGLLFTIAFVLYAVAPAAVYFIPDDSTPLIAAQVNILICVHVPCNLGRCSIVPIINIRR